MANPVTPGTLENWISDQIWPNVATPKTSDTGTLEAWVSDQIWMMVYTEAAAVAGVAMPIFGNDDQLFGSIFCGAIVR